MRSKFLERRNITPQQAMNILRKNGLEVTENQAKNILDFLYVLAKLVLKEHFQDRNQVSGD